MCPKPHAYVDGTHLHCRLNRRGRGGGGGGGGAKENDFAGKLCELSAKIPSSHHPWLDPGISRSSSSFNVT